MGDPKKRRVGGWFTRAAGHGAGDVGHPVHLEPDLGTRKGQHQAPGGGGSEPHQVGHIGTAQVHVGGDVPVRHGRQFPPADSDLSAIFSTARGKGEGASKDAEDSITKTVARAVWREAWQWWEE